MREKINFSPQYIEGLTKLVHLKEHKNQITDIQLKKLTKFFLKKLILSKNKKVTEAITVLSKLEYLDVKGATEIDNAIFPKLGHSLKYLNFVDNDEMYFYPTFMTLTNLSGGNEPMTFPATDSLKNERLLQIKQFQEDVKNMLFQKANLYFLPDDIWFLILERVVYLPVRPEFDKVLCFKTMAAYFT